jgi:hypothetical protein
MRTRFLTLLGAAALTLTMASPALAGPPWISAEYPSNPFHDDTRGSLMLVHTFHHGVARQFPVTAVAEGLVKGRRQTVQLQVTQTYREGVYAVRGNLPKDGNWVLVVTMNESDANSKANLLASMNGAGEILTVNVPHDLKNGWIVPRPATSSEINAALQSAVAMSQASRPLNGAASVGVIGLVLLGSLVGLRKRQR